VLDQAERQRFGKLTVVRDAGMHDGRRLVLCRCACGSEKIFKLNHLKTGNTKSCGCYKKEWSSENGKKNRTHGETLGRRTAEYKTWHSMIQRCEYPKHVDFKNYGAKGISVCPRWRESFEVFLEDMGRKPSPLHTIERKDVRGNYEPSNCRWATQKEQQRNRSSNRILVIDGKAKCVSEWLEVSRSGVSKELCNYRLKAGWEAKKAVFTPPGKYVRR
jgi:hypothetical protein